MAVPRPKAYPSFLVVISTDSGDEASYIVKAANMQAAASNAITRLQENNIDNFDSWDVEERPDGYSVTIYALADERQEYTVKSAGIVLEKVGE